MVSTPVTLDEVGRCARTGDRDLLRFDTEQVLARVARRRGTFRLPRSGRTRPRIAGTGTNRSLRRRPPGGRLSAEVEGAYTVGTPPPSVTTRMAQMGQATWSSPQSR